MTMRKDTPHCPKCGATKCHWRYRFLLSDDPIDWDTDDPSEANPVDGYRCPHCGIAIVDYARYERDLDDGSVLLYEYAPKYCMGCGKELTCD